MPRPQSPRLDIDQKWESHVWDLLTKHYGIHKIPGYRFVRSGQKRIRLISEAALSLLSEVPYTGTTGLYIGEYSPRGVRLSMDGAQLLGHHASKQIARLTAKEADSWLQGESINYEDEQRGYVIVVHGHDVLGCGNLSQGVLHNYVPKIRRTKKSEKS